MIQKYFQVMTVALILVGCVPKDNFSSYPGTTTGGTTAGTTSTTGGTSYPSCSALSAYTTLAQCKSTTFAQCYPSTKIIQNQTAVCYFPVTGWESCSTNQATWSYGSWSNWCAESPGVFVRNRTATCQRTVAACDCVSDSFAQERCPSSASPTCQTAGVATSTFCAGATPTPTATPTSTPSWCSRTFLNYQVGGNNSESVLRSANGSRFSQIRSFFSNRGYGVTNIRGSTYNLSSLGPLLDTDRASAYVVQIEASSSGCFIGSKINMTIRLLKGGVQISSGSETTACVSFGDEIGRAVDRSLDRMNAPNCQ